MKGEKHSPEQIIVKLLEAKAELNGGATIGQVCTNWGSANRRICLRGAIAGVAPSSKPPASIGGYFTATTPPSSRSHPCIA